MRYIELLGRILFSAIFLSSAANQFSKQTIGYAAKQGVPLPGIAVPLSGVIAILGGLSVLFGYRTKIGGALLVLFLAPVTLMMHNFWAYKGAEAQTQQINFMKNIAMLGGALIISYFGAGSFSVDEWLNARSKKSKERASKA